MTCTLAGHLKGSGSSEFSGHDSAQAEESRIYLVLGYILQSVIAAVTPALLTRVFAHLLVTVSNERRKVMNRVAESQLLGSVRGSLPVWGTKRRDLMHIGAKTDSFRLFLYIQSGAVRVLVMQQLCSRVTVRTRAQIIDH